MVLEIFECEDEDDPFRTFLDDFVTSGPQIVRHNGICQGLADLFNNEQLSDCSIVFTNNNQQLYLHKLVLATSSDFFSACLLGGMRESIDGNIELDDEENTIPNVIILLQSLYTGFVQVQDSDSAIALLKIADKYQLKSLEPSLVDYIINKVNINNALTSFYLQLDRDNPVYARIFNMIYLVLRENKVTLLSGDTLLSLEFDDYVSVLENVNATEVPILAIVNMNRWIEKDEEIRSVFSRKLIKVLANRPAQQ
jgi:hypothetical protein